MDCQVCAFIRSALFISSGDVSTVHCRAASDPYDARVGYSYGEIPGSTRVRIRTTTTNEGGQVGWMLGEFRVRGTRVEPRRWSGPLFYLRFLRHSAAAAVQPEYFKPSPTSLFILFISRYIYIYIDRLGLRTSAHRAFERRVGVMPRLRHVSPVPPPNLETPK
jgi:hypothetical protein